MIIWLASYPRSGNTFLRTVLYHSFGFQSYSLYEEAWDNEQDLFPLSPLPDTRKNLTASDKIFLVKTHELPNDDNPCIYLVRDGRDCLVSYAWYTLTIEHGLPKETISTDEYQATLEDIILNNEYFGGWSRHVQEWIHRKANSSIIHFEDLINAPEQTVQQALNQLQLMKYTSHVEDITYNFDDFKSLMPKFFRSGKVGNWEEHMSERLCDLFWLQHGHMMEELNYQKNKPLKTIVDGLHLRNQRDSNETQGDPSLDTRDNSNLTSNQQEQPSLPAPTDYQARIEIAKSGMAQVKDIPKVPNAGDIVQENGSHYQIMFNGVKVPANAYYGEWVTSLIRVCQGHHEPQEEFVFHHVIQKAPDGAIIMELGSYWAFYSTWFLSHVADSRAFLVEPDPKNLPTALATLNANNCSAHIELAAIGERVEEFEHIRIGATTAPNYAIPVTQVDELMQKHGIDHLYILHSDIQGAELKMLQGAKDSLGNEKIDYVFISTHADDLHVACIDTLEAFNYRILAEHNLAESYSFDGLIVACSSRLHDFEDFSLMKRTPSDWQPTEDEASIEPDKLETDGFYSTRREHGEQTIAGLQGELEAKERVIQELAQNQKRTQQDLEAKERVIQELLNQRDVQQELEAKERVIQELVQNQRKIQQELAANEETIQELVRQVYENRGIIQDLAQQQELSEQLEAKEANIQELNQALEAKEAVIQSLIVHRRWSLRYQARRVMNNFLASRPIAFAKRIRHFLTIPRLGKIRQYAPRKIVIPDFYHKTSYSDNLPSISIVTPSYNQANFIEATIKSVIEQSFPKLEYIIQDAASTDGTRDILARYEKRVAHIESQPDAGQANAVNIGLNKSSGDIMAYLNSDDLLLPGSLHYVASFFAENPEVDAVYGHRVIINEQGLEIGRWILPPHDNEALHWADYVPQETLFWRRRIWEKVGEFDETFKFALDWDYIIRMQDAGAKIVRLPRFIGAFRIHNEQKTIAQLHAVGFKEMNRIRKRIHGYIPTYEEVQQKLKPYYRQHLREHQLYRLGLKRF